MHSSTDSREGPPRPSPRVLLAMDKFKGTLSSLEAAHAVRVGILKVMPSAEVTTVSVADGGDGTTEAVIAAGFSRRQFSVTGPLGSGIDVDIAVRGGTGVIEVASVCGLQLVPRQSRRPLDASSRGVGEILCRSTKEGIRSVVLGLGGSATTDGGVGMLAAIGIVFYDFEGTPFIPVGGSLHDIARVDWSGIDRSVLALELRAASDVNNPLLGPEGAAHVYGPQKGANTGDVDRLEAGLAHLVTVFDEFPPPWMARSTASQIAQEPGTGAAGGIGFAARLMRASILPGASIVLDLLDVPALINVADLVVTGEGRLDAQSLRGKLPVVVAQLAADRGVPTVAAVGQCTLTSAEVASSSFASIWSLNDVDPDTINDPDLSKSALSTIGERLAISLAAPAPRGSDSPVPETTDIPSAVHN
jgi:glycerate kinase